AGTGPLDEFAVGVAQLDRAGAYDEQLRGRRTRGQHHVAAAPVDDAQPGGQRLEDVGGEGAEGLVGREEVADLGELDVEGHGAIIATSRPVGPRPGAPENRLAGRARSATMEHVLR